MPFSTAAQTSLLALLCENTAWANVGTGAGLQPSSVAGDLYIALHTASPGASGNQSTSEAAYAGYSRVGISRTSGLWTPGSGTIANASAVTFPACTSGTETETYFSVGTSASGAGEVIAYGPIGTLAISQGLAPNFSAGELILNAAGTGLVGSGAITFGPTGVLTGIGALAGVGAATFAVSGALSGGSVSAPVVLYTDIVSGSATNGESGAGSYLSIFGYNFGSTLSAITVAIGSATVANLRTLDNAVVNGVRPGLVPMQRIICQVGSTAVQALTAGTAYGISVIVGGVASNTNDVLGNPLQFTIQPGHFWFVDTVAGSDSTGVKDSISQPFRYIQNAGGGSTYTGVFGSGNIAAGDTVVIRGNSGTPITDQVGFDGRLMRWSQHSLVGGTAPTGTTGAGYVHFTAYPGPINGGACEDVYIFTPASGGANCGGFMGAGELYTRPNSPNAGQYWSCSNMRSSCASTGTFSSDASNYNLQNSADFTRFVNLDVQWPATSGTTASQKAGGIVGNGYHVWWLGNYIHNIAGGGSSDLENHGLYADGSNTDAAWVEIGFNAIINCTTGQCIQFHQEAATGFHDCYIHHNWCENSAKYGMKMDGWSGIMRWWNNVVVYSNREAFQIDATGATGAGDVAIENNTFYDGYWSTSGAYQAQIANEGANVPGTFTIRNNIIAFSAASTAYTSTWITGQSLGTISGNLYYDYSGRLTTKYSGDSAGVYGNPQFTDAATFPNSDLRLGATSAALGRAVIATINPTNDLGMNIQPRSGQSVASVGAFA